MEPVVHFKIAFDHAACGEVIGRRSIEPDSKGEPVESIKTLRPSTHDLGRVTCLECRAALAVTTLIQPREAEKQPEPAAEAPPATAPETPVLQ